MLHRLDRRSVRDRVYPLAIAGVILAGLLLRLAPITANRFHEDEAHYSYWGLQIASGADPLLDREPVDKPPLFLYLQAFAFIVFGRSEWAARLPNLLASVCGMVAFQALARRVYGRPVALLATLALAFNPFDIAFAASAFTDPLMVALVVGALALAVAGRPGVAGLCLGLSFAAKQQGIFFAPLVFGAGLIAGHPTAETQRTQSDNAERTILRCEAARSGASSDAGSANRRIRVFVARLRGRLASMPFLRGAVGLLLGAAPALIWDAVRTRDPGYLAQSLLSYGGLRLTPWSTWAERADDWLAVLRTLPGWPLELLLAGLAVLLIVDFVAVLGKAVTLRYSEGPREAARVAPKYLSMTAIRAAFDLLLAGFSILFIVGHLWLTFNAWDRYLLGLAPLIALLIGRIVVLPIRGSRLLRENAVLALPVIAVILAGSLAAGAATAARGQYPAGGDHGAYDGIDAVAAYVRDNVPAEAIIHQRNLGWHFQYYMYGFPHAFRWYAEPDDLIAHATEWPDVPQWLVIRAWDGYDQEAARLAQAGLTLREEFHALRRDGSVSFRVFRLIDLRTL